MSQHAIEILGNTYLIIAAIIFVVGWFVGVVVACRYADDAFEVFGMVVAGTVIGTFAVAIWPVTLFVTFVYQVVNRSGW